MTLTADSQARRARKVGASEVAALLPCGHPFMTPADVWSRIKLGWQRAPSEAMHLGSALEPVVLALGAERLGIRYRRNRHTYAHPSLPLVATPDAMVPGHPALVEVKNVSQWAAEDWWDGPPPHVRAQVQCQLMLTHRRFGHVVALLGGSRIGTWTLEADRGEQRAIRDAVRRFAREYLDTDTPPPGAEPELLLTVAAPEGTVNATGDLLAAGEALYVVTSELRDMGAREQWARDWLMEVMAEAGARLVVAPDWTAEARAASSGKWSLRFTRKRKGEQAA